MQAMTTLEMMTPQRKQEIMKYFDENPGGMPREFVSELLTEVQRLQSCLDQKIETSFFYWQQRNLFRDALIQLNKQIDEVLNKV